jgi:hypothetical protein
MQRSAWKEPSEERGYAPLLTCTDELLFEFVVTLVVVFPELVLVTWSEDSTLF